jgi:transcriptional regulator with XRE-family HTH domain
MLTLQEKRSAVAAEGKITLGKYLESIRVDRGLTQRQVEAATNKAVSNAYLSQIENDKIQKPSPNILHVLAELYGISYEALMEMAGYFVTSTSRTAEERHGRVATFSELNLTQEEEAKLAEYLLFLRSRKKTGDQGG